MNKIPQCPVCSCEKWKKFSRWDHPQEHRKFVKCSGCGHVYAADFSPVELDRAYQEDYYPSADDPKIQQWIDANKDVWLDTVRDILQFRKEFRSILDYGAGTGGFLEQFDLLTGKTAEIFAVENAVFAKENLRNRFPGANIFSTLDECTKKDFDCIAVLQCFEHLDHPLQICKDLRSRLKKGGVMIITVPNRYSLRTICRGRKDHLNAGHSTHLQFFSHSGMRKMLKNAGFTQIYRVTNYPQKGSFLKRFLTWFLRKAELSSELRFICIAD